MVPVILKGVEMTLLKISNMEGILPENTAHVDNDQFTFFPALYAITCFQSPLRSSIESSRKQF